MKNMTKRLLCLFTAFFILLLSACVQKPQAEETTEWEGKGEFEASDDMTDDEAKLEDRHKEYAKNSLLAFSQTVPAAENDFKVSDIEGGVKIDEYVGKSDIVVIPDTIGGVSVTGIAKNAFTEKKVRAIYIPDSVVSIEKSALEGVVGLSTLRLPVIGNGENTYLGYIFGADSYERNAVKVPASLDMVILGDGITEIADNAFAGCKGISAVVFSKNLEKIGKFAFYECQDLVYISLENSVKTVGEYALGYCSSLFIVSFTEIESMGLGALYECNSIRELTLNIIGKNKNENNYIGHIFGAESADYNDEFVPKSLSAVNCDSVPDRAFAGCADIDSIIISANVECVGVRAFYGCRSLRNIVIPEGVKAIGDDAFFGCDNLESVELGSGLESIGMQAFYGCKALKTIEMPEKITEINASTFALCSSLETVKLNKVKKIGKDAFWGCKSLKAVDCNGIEVADGNTDLTTD